MPVRVKICGITNRDDAWNAIGAGADALGFMFYAKSSRHLDPVMAGAIIRQLPPFVAKVGVFVDATAEEVRTAVAKSGIDTLQFHGDETPAFCRQFGLRTIKAFRIKDADSLPQLKHYEQEAWLLDSYVPGAPGGTGVRFNWELAVQMVLHHPTLILAGGLTPENAAEAVQRVRPYALDVSSGVESAPGKKDPAMVRAFIAAAREAALDDSGPRG